MHRLRRRRTAHPPREVFSFNEGMGELVGQLAGAPGVKLRTDLRVVELVRDGHGWRVVADGADGPRQVRAAHVVLGVPAGVAANLLAAHDDELSAALDGIGYAPLAVVHCGYATDDVGHSLDGTGFLVPRRERLAINGNLWLSSLFPGRAPSGRVLLSSYVGGSRRPEMLERDDRQLVAGTHRTLVPLLGLRGGPEWWRVDRHRAAMPLYYGAYPERLRFIGDRLQRLPGLEIVANYRGGVSVRDRIVEGAVAATRIADRLGATQRHPKAWPVSATPQPVR